MSDTPTDKDDRQWPLLEARSVTKIFPGVRALDSVDFTLHRSEIHAIMGENGAGKSTLIKVLTGVYRPDDGHVVLDGADVHFHRPSDAQRYGISTVYQEVNLIPGLSVAENIFLGRQPTTGTFINWPRMHRAAQHALSRLNVNIDVSQPLAKYSPAIQQMVAIARALDTSAKVLVFDEPTSSLDQAEVASLFKVMRSLRTLGIGIIFITHFIDQVFEVADRVTVLRNGRLVGRYQTASLSRLGLVSKMLGREIEARQSVTRQETDERRAPRTVVVTARDLGRRGSVEGIDFEVHKGEVVGLAGLLGSGRTETARLLFGLDRPDYGHIEIGGRVEQLRSPKGAIARRLAMLPEDRKTQGLISDLSVRENVVLALQARRGWLRRLGMTVQRRLADRYIESLRIATTNAEKPVRELSGGNQQKVILARWLATDPVLLILDEPTRGIDIGAKAEVEKLIATLCKSGMSIVFISSELEEVVRDSHRVVVLRDLRTVGVLTGEEVTEQHVMQMIAGVGGAA